MRTLIVIVSLLFIALATAAGAAHAFLDHASPLVGARWQRAARSLAVVHAKSGAVFQHASR